MKNINNFISKLRKQCTPAYFYLILSIISLVVLLIENISNFDNNEYCVGSFTCNVSNTALVFAMKILYVGFWTLALNCLCKSGYTNIAWFLVLLPFILFFVIIGLLMLNQGVLPN